MISDLISGLDKKFEDRLNTLYTFSASVLGLVSVISGGQPPLAFLSRTSATFFGSQIPWFESAQTWLDGRTWLTPAVCTGIVTWAAIAVVFQGFTARRSRAAATLWLLTALAVSRGSDLWVLAVVIAAVVIIGGLIQHRLNDAGGVPAEAVILAFIEAPIRLMGWLWGHIKWDDEPQAIRIVDHARVRPASGSRVV